MGISQNRTERLAMEASSSNTNFMTPGICPLVISCYFTPVTLPFLSIVLSPFLVNSQFLSGGGGI